MSQKRRSRRKSKGGATLKVTKTNAKYLLTKGKKPAKYVRLEGEEELYLVAIHAPGTKGQVYRSYAVYSKSGLEQCELFTTVDELKAGWQANWSCVESPCEAGCVVATVDFIPQGVFEPDEQFGEDDEEVAEDPIFLLDTGTFLNANIMDYVKDFEEFLYDALEHLFTPEDSQAVSDA